jgi:hypothetical protein
LARIVSQLPPLAHAGLAFQARVALAGAVPICAPAEAVRSVATNGMLRSVTDPSCPDLENWGAMVHRNVPAALIATATGAAMSSKEAAAQLCTAPYPQTAPELAAVNPTSGTA